MNLCHPHYCGQRGGGVLKCPTHLRYMENAVPVRVCTDGDVIEVIEANPALDIKRLWFQDVHVPYAHHHHMGYRLGTTQGGRGYPKGRRCAGTWLSGYTHLPILSIDLNDVVCPHDSCLVKLCRQLGPARVTSKVKAVTAEWNWKAAVELEEEEEEESGS